MAKKTFYGWYVLLGLCLIYAASNGIVTLSLKRFYPSLIDVFSWTREEVTRPVSVFYFALAFLTPVIGALLDRRNPKRIMLIGSIIILIGLALMGRIQNLNQFIGIYIILAIGLAGAGLISSMYILTKWFHKHRGKAVGILLVGGSLGGALFNKITGDAIDAIGWRDATLLLAAIGAVFMIVPWIFLVKNKPQEMGLFPDGGDSEPEINLLEGMSLAEAFKTPTLYLIFLATGILWFCIIGIQQHQDIYLQKELTIPSEVVTNVGSAFFLFGVLGKLIFGFLSDRFNKKLVMAASIALLIVGLIFLRLMGTDQGNWSPYYYATTFGIAYSGVFTMIQIVVADLYYGKSYGKILGIVLTVDTLASVAGIMFLGKMSGADGTYVPAFGIMAIMCAVALISFMVVKTNFKAAHS
ncbi:MAG: MFS transporter [Saprospiraceae bacterium]|nr:MFS transporter [Saprospiraceae bacterium]